MPVRCSYATPPSLEVVHGVAIREPDVNGSNYRVVYSSPKQAKQNLSN